MGNLELVVKAAEENEVGVFHRVQKHAEQLFRQRPLGNAVVIVKPRLSAPADVEGGVNVGLAPLHDLAQLGPVVHLFKGQILHRRAGDDQSVKGSVLHLLKGLVKSQHVLLRGVFGHVPRRGNQLQLDLKRGVAQNPGQLRLCVRLGGHQVQQEDLQGPDILGHGAGLGHNEDIFAGQRTGGRQLIWNFDRQSWFLLSQRRGAENRRIGAQSFT